MNFEALTTVARAIACAGLISAILVLQAPASAADEYADAASQELGTRILDQVPNYVASRKDRALAACIDWDAPSKQWIEIRNVFWFYTDPGSDVPVFHSKLMNRAIAECERNKAAGTACRCLRVAMDDNIVLEVPTTVLARLKAEKNQQPEFGTIWHRPSALTDLEFAQRMPDGSMPLLQPGELSLASDAVVVLLSWDLALRADTSFTLRYRLVDPNGATQQRHETEIYPSFEGGRSWHSFPIRHQLDHAGLWRIAIDLDGETVAERPLQIQPAP